MSRKLKITISLSLPTLYKNAISTSTDQSLSLYIRLLLFIIIILDYK